MAEWVVPIDDDGTSSGFGDDGGSGGSSGASDGGSGGSSGASGGGTTQPSGETSFNPNKDASREEIQKMTREFAEYILDEFLKDNITSCEAMAVIFSYGADFYIERGFLGNNQEEELLEDMAKILAGVGEWPGIQSSDGTQVGQTKFNDSGFKSQFQDGSNQVQHFTAAVQSGYQYEALGYLHHVFRPDSAQDEELNNIGIRLGRALNGCCVSLEEIGDWIRENVCDLD